MKVDVLVCCCRKDSTRWKIIDRREIKIVNLTFLMFWLYFLVAQLVRIRYSYYIIAIDRFDID